MSETSTSTRDPAVPWTVDASTARTLIAAIRAATDAFITDADRKPVRKPHGRLAIAMHLVGSGSYIDLSVMPRRRARATGPDRR